MTKPLVQLHPKPIEEPLIEIRLTNCALDESPLRGGCVILRGVVEATHLEALKVDDYQRERKPVRGGDAQ